MKIAVIGTGYVGLVTGVSLSILGHVVTCVGREEGKIDKINSGISPFYEPGLNELIQKMVEEKKLSATTDFLTVVKSSEVVIIAVGTPTVKGKIDLSAIKLVSRQIGQAIKNTPDYKVIVMKSTVVPSTTEKIVGPLVEKYSGKKIGEFGLCMNPEFLREGNAVEDAIGPDRIVIGCVDKKSGNEYAKVYVQVDCPKIFVNLRTAELTKYASNALLATMISYSNEMARIAEDMGGIDIVDVWKAVHLDRRLSPIVDRKKITPPFLSYIYSGCGYGGSCFPKDTKAIAAFAKSAGISSKIINAVIDVNSTQSERVLNLLKKSVGNLRGKKIALLGLSFKPDTDDMRESPSLFLIELLKKEGASIRATDPQAYEINKEMIDKSGIQYYSSVLDVLNGAEAAVIMTSWDEYKKIKPFTFRQYMKTPVVVDGRRIYNKNEFLKEGVLYCGIGLGPVK